MTITDWATILAAVGTIAAAGVAAYSAHLAWKQVRYQFEARLLVMPTQFQFRIAKDAIDKMWLEPPPEDLQFKNVPLNFSLTLVNIGNGPAFRVQIFTEYDYEKVFVATRDLLSKLRPDLDFDHDGFGLKVTRSGKTIAGFRLPDQNGPTLDHIAGATHEDSRHTFMLEPNLAFFAICQASGAFLTDTERKILSGPSNIPVTFRVKYLDASGQAHVATLRHRCSFESSMARPDYSEGTAIMSLTADEVS